VRLFIFLYETFSQCTALYKMKGGVRQDAEAARPAGSGVTITPEFD
jgi:hypothetical protein